MKNQKETSEEGRYSYISEIIERPVNNYNELLIRIQLLKDVRKLQEEELKLKLKNMSDSMNLFSIMRRGITGINPFEILKNGINLLMELLINKIFRRSRTTKGFLVAVIVEKVINYLIENNLDTFIETVKQFFQRQTAKKEEDNYENETTGNSKPA